MTGVQWAVLSAYAHSLPSGPERSRLLTLCLREQHVREGSAFCIVGQQNAGCGGQLQQPLPFCCLAQRQGSSRCRRVYYPHAHDVLFRVGDADQRDLKPALLMLRQAFIGQPVACCALPNACNSVYRVAQAVHLIGKATVALQVCQPKQTGGELISTLVANVMRVVDTQAAKVRKQILGERGRGKKQAERQQSVSHGIHVARSRWKVAKDVLRAPVTQRKRRDSLRLSPEVFRPFELVLKGVPLLPRTVARRTLMPIKSHPA